MNQIKELREHVEKEFGIDNLRERRRYNDIVNARMVYSYILRGLGYSLTDIGKSLGKHHATIINYLDNMEGYLKTDPVLRKKFDKVSRSFLGEEMEIDNSSLTMDATLKYAELKEVELKNKINILESRIKDLTSEVLEYRSTQKFNSDDIDRFYNIFKLVKQKTKHGDEFKVFQKLNKLYDVI
jgi:hypothetical protein